MESNESSIGGKILDAFISYSLKEHEYNRRYKEHEILHGLIQKLPGAHIDDEEKRKIKALIISTHRGLNKEIRQNKKEYEQAKKQYKELIKDIEDDQLGELLDDYVSRHKMEKLVCKYYPKLLAIKNEAIVQAFLTGVYGMLEENMHMLSEIEESEKRIEKRLKTIESNM